MRLSWSPRKEKAPPKRGFQTVTKLRLDQVPKPVRQVAGMYLSSTDVFAGSEESRDNVPTVSVATLF
jgi:hypothetical protein